MGFAVPMPRLPLESTRILSVPLVLMMSGRLSVVPTNWEAALMLELPVSCHDSAFGEGAGFAAAAGFCVPAMLASTIDMARSTKRKGLVDMFSCTSLDCWPPVVAGIPAEPAFWPLISQVFHRGVNNRVKIC